MAITKLRDWTVGTDGAFRCPVQTLEDLGATRAMLTTDDGVCQGYAHPTDARLWCGPLVTPTGAKVTADAAAVTAAATDATKTSLAITAITNEATRILAIAAGSRTSTEKGFLGVAWMLNKLG
jgi:hypothetical protein